MTVAAEALSAGLEHAVWLIAPVAGSAAAAALLVGWLCHRLGVHDPAPVLVARSAAALAVVWWFGGQWLADGAGWTRALWQHLAEIGRGLG